MDRLIYRHASTTVANGTFNSAAIFRHDTPSYRRPDRAKPILEDALQDWRDVIRIYAQVLLEQFYY